MENRPESQTKIVPSSLKSLPVPLSSPVELTVNKELFVGLSNRLSFTITAQILARSIHSHFDDVLTKFMINNRTDA